MNISTTPVYKQLSLLPPRRANGRMAEVCIISTTTELLLQSQPIEQKTQVVYLGRRVVLWEALKSVTETCFSLWMQTDDTDLDAFIRDLTVIKERLAKEGSQLVLTALQNPMQAKAVARVLQLGNNFLRTLDKCMDAILRYPGQRSLSKKPMRVEILIDWALGGIAEWHTHYPYAMEKDGPGSMVTNEREVKRISKPYTTDRNVRSQTSTKIIGNIFFLDEREVVVVEQRGIQQMRQSLGSKPSFDASSLFA